MQLTLNAQKLNDSVDPRELWYSSERGQMHYGWYRRHSFESMEDGCGMSSRRTEHWGEHRDAGHEVSSSAF